LTINPGETVAIVGENGAGKSTLVRLLIGLYTPDEGRVYLHGVDTANAGLDTLSDGVSGVFQKYQRYQMILAENVSVSQVDKSESIDKAIKQAGIEFNENNFPKGKDTMLSREFNGIDVSGGEWQRIAIARGLYRSYDLIVLDEPTASIDPIEESRIYRNFIDISKGKTAILVTHRLSSVKIADRVIVMDSGKIVDMGLHSELLARNGLYAKMYNSQAAWYN
jgi:ATP-binding cassette subfamily B protein